MFGQKRSKNASAIVTGAGSGIGKAFALEIAKRGGRVVCADINLAAAEETAQQIIQSGGSAHALQCDVSKLDEVENLAQAAEQWLNGPVDLVINNAGVATGGHPIGEVSMEDWRWVVDVNLWGVVHGCHVFAPKLKQLGRGGIINVASSAGFASAPLMGPYNATKAAVVAISETLLAELSGSGVGVSVLCPTFVATNIIRNSRGHQGTLSRAQKLMDRAGMAPEKVVKLCLDALDGNQFYVMPQVDARLMWRIKRLLPQGYHASLGILNRLAAKVG
ncbi:MAG TPA: SDR family NAD(P)-dependent oxidoreductase [Pseudomonadales bacterium]|nr:SDR family NAD(P)-dependent oxidoreductase [Pseudomonadales bacterium]